MTIADALPRRPTRIDLVALCLAALSALILGRQLGLDYLVGGDAFRQGDWLIHADAGPVRRGLFGSALLRIADALGLDPLAAVVALQGLLLGVIALALAPVVWRLTRAPEWWLLFLSPAFIPLFWGADPIGSLRKEVIAFAAFALLLPGFLASVGARGLIALSVLLFALALTGHEALILLSPAYAGLLWLASSHAGLSRGLRLGLIATLALAGIAAAGYTVAFAQAEPGAICAALLERGPGAQFCGGAIGYLEHTGAEAAAEMSAQLAGSGALMSLVAWALAAAPVLYLVSRHSGAGWVVALFALTVLSVAPLFAVAADWGRWVQLQMISFGCLLAGLALSGRIVPVRQASPRLILIVLVLGAVWSPRHHSGIEEGGLAKQLVYAATEAR